MKEQDRGPRFPAWPSPEKRAPRKRLHPKGDTAQKSLRLLWGSFPAEKPEYLILISVDEPEPSHYGGVVAAPAFKEVALKTLAFMGGLPDTPAVVANNDTILNNPTPVRFCSSAEMRGKVDRTCVIPGDAVPDVRGLSIRRAMEIFAGKGVVPSLKGAGSMVTRQEPVPGKPWPVGANQCILWLQDNAERS